MDNDKQSGTPNYIPTASDDPEMLDAMEQARSTFLEFIKEVKADWQRTIPILPTTIVKGYFADSEAPHNGEHLWIDFEGYKEDLILGTLMSAPGYITCVSQGDPVWFPLPRLSDWLYVLDDTAHGAFTIQVLRSRMTPAERSQHDAAYPFKFKA